MSADQFYTYFHTRNDTGAVFYVGKGKGLRAHSSKRNALWKRISEKHGHTVHIASEWPTEAEAFEHEKFLIACFRDMGVPLANMTDGGEGVSGFVLTDAMKSKLSKSLRMGFLEHPERAAKISIALKGRVSPNKGRVASKETRKKISDANSGRKHSEESLKKISESQIGRVMSEETKSKMSAAAKARKAREGNTFFAPSATKEQLAEWRKKSSDAQIGKKLSNEHKSKISAAGIGRVSANKGKILPEEWRAKMSAAGKGRPKSEEHKAKIKAAHIARAARLKAEKLQ